MEKRKGKDRKRKKKGLSLVASFMIFIFLLPSYCPFLGVGMNIFFFLSSLFRYLYMLEK